MLKNSKAFKFLIGSVAVAAFAFAITVSAAYDFGSVTLRVGSKGEAVKAVQTVVGATPVDGIYGKVTAAKVMAWQANNGLTADGVFGPASKAKANSTTVVTTTPVTTTPTTTTTLSGGAGDLTVDSSSKNIESSVKEGDEENVLVYKLTAEDSDIQVTSIKVFLQNDGTTSGSSEKLADYVDEVKVYLGSEEVGSVDASDFSKESADWDEYTKSISLKDAVVSEDDSDYLYVAIVAADDLDTEDQAANWNVAVTSLRFVDAAGAIMSADTSDTAFTGDNADIETVEGDSENFDFELSSESDQIDIKSSSTDPDASTLKVDADTESDEFLVGAFKLDVDEDSSDISILEIPVVMTISGNTIDNGSDNADEIISSVTVKIDGEEYDAELVDSTNFNVATGTPKYLVSFDSGEMVIDAGDVVEVKIYATFNDQDENYDSGSTKVKASVTMAGIEAENEDEDSVEVGGVNYVGEEHTLSIDAATISNIKWTVNSTGTMIDFTFTVEAEDEDFDVTLASITANDDMDNGDASGSSVTAPTALSKVSGTATTDDAGLTYTVDAGDTATFRARYTVSGTNGDWAEVVITSVAGQTVADEDQTSPTATYNVN